MVSDAHAGAMWLRRVGCGSSSEYILREQMCLDASFVDRSCCHGSTTNSKLEAEAPLLHKAVYYGRIPRMT